MLRAIALSLVLLFSLGTIIPLITETTEAGPRHHLKKKHKKKLRKYSKAWWRWYHKMKKRKRAIAARKRALRLKQIILAKRKAKRKAAAANQTSRPKVQKKADPVAVKDDVAPVLPTGKRAPKSFKRVEATPGEQQFAVKDDNGNPVGSASLSIVGPSLGTDSSLGRAKTLGGVQVSDLRRRVIDRMFKEDGWVVNDYHKEINGKNVYVVVAQSANGGRIQSRTFYFTEVDGKIYSLATNAPVDSAERIAAESEKVINSLQRNGNPLQAKLQ